MTVAHSDGVLNV